MRKLHIVTRTLLALAISSHLLAQIPSGYVQANATVPALANGSFGAAWTNLSSSPQLGLLGCVSTFQTTVNGTIDSFGKFSVLLADPTQICPSPSTWTFTFSCHTPPAAFITQITISGGGSPEDITSQILAAAPSNLCQGGGSGLAVQTNGAPNLSQTLLNFVNPAGFNGLGFTFSNPSGGIETFGVSGKLNNSGITNPQTTVNGQTCTLGGSCTVTTAAATSIQTNGTPNTSQVVLNHVDTASVKWSNPSGGVEEANVNVAGGFQMPETPPVGGQYVVIHAGATSSSVTSICTAGAVNITKSSMTGIMGKTGGLCSQGLIGIWSSYNLSLPPEVLAGTITAIYPFSWSQSTGGSAGTVCTYGGLHSTAIDPGIQGFPMTYTVATPVGWGTDTSQVQCNFGASSSSTPIQFSYNIPDVGLFIYYTGTPVAASTNINILPPLYLDPYTSSLGLVIPFDNGVDTGATGTTYVVNLAGYGSNTPLPGTSITFIPAHTSTSTNPTFNFNGIGASTIVSTAGTALTIGDLNTNHFATVKYNGNWELQNPQVSGGGGGSISGQTAGYAIEAAGPTTATSPFPMDDSVSAANTVTIHKRTVIDDGSGQNGAFGFKAGSGILAPAATYAIVGNDGSGNGILSENGASYSRICTAANGICAGSGNLASINSQTGPAITIHSSDSSINVNTTTNDIDLTTTGGGSSQLKAQRAGTLFSPASAVEYTNGEASVIYEGSCKVLTSLTSCFKMWYAAGYSSPVPVLNYAESADGLPGTWTQYASNPVNTTCATHGWVFENSGTYHEYCSNSPGASGVNHYTSADGLTWTLSAANVITATQAWQGSSGPGNSAVIVVGGTWYNLQEWTTASGSAGWRTGLWTSSDGNTWTAYAGNPIIPTTGTSSAGMCGGAWLTNIGGTFYALLHCAGPDGTATGDYPTDIYEFTSPDAQTWTLKSTNPVIQRATTDEGFGYTNSQVADPYLVQATDPSSSISKTYLYYEATQNGSVAGTSADDGWHMKVAVINDSLATALSSGMVDGDSLATRPVFMVDGQPAKSQNFLSVSGGQQTRTYQDGNGNIYLNWDFCPALDSEFSNFLGTSGTLLTSYTSACGYTYIQYTAAGATGVPKLATGVVASGQSTDVMNAIGNTSDSYVLSTYTPPSADYSVQAEFTKYNSGDNVLYGRASSGAYTTYYFACTGTTCVLDSIVAGSATALGTVSFSWATNTTHTMTLKMVGSSIVGSVDGTALISVTDTAISTVGQGGFRLNTDNGARTFRIQPIYSSSGGGGGTGLFSGLIYPPTLAGTGLTTSYAQNANFTSQSGDIADGILVKDGTNNTTLEGWLTTYPATPFTLTFLVSPIWPGANFTQTTLLVTSSTTGNAMAFEQGYGSGGSTFNPLALQTYSTPSTFVSTVTSSSIAGPLPFLWCRYQDDGTNITYSWGIDGTNFSQIYSVAKASSFLASSGFNFIGFGLANNTSAGAATLKSWHITTP